MGIFRLPDGAPADATSRACSTQISSSQIDEKRRAVTTYKYIDISSMRADVMGLLYSPSLNTLILSFSHDNANYHALLFQKTVFGPETTTLILRARKTCQGRQLIKIQYSQF